MITHTSIEGGPSTGKSTLQEQLKPFFKDHIHTDDLARVYLRRYGLNANNLTQEQTQQMQLWVSASYIGNMKQAEMANKHHLTDSSLLTAYAYGWDSLSASQLSSVARIIDKYKESMRCIIIPPTIPIHNDGLRHIDPQFRIKIHGRIMQIIESFKIPYQYILGSTVQERTHEAKEYIELFSSEF